MPERGTRTVFVGGEVFDGSRAAPVAADVVIEGGRIVAVGAGLDGDVAVDATGRAILPGLMDCHVHVMVDSVDLMAHLQRPFSYAFYLAIGHLAAMLDCGITTVRDAGGADLGVKQAVEDGLIEGPRMKTAISILGQTGGHTDGWQPSGIDASLFPPHPGRPDPIVDGPDEMRRKVRELVRAGADVIKICTSGGVVSPRDDPRHAHFGADELGVCVAEASAAGISVMAHAQGAAGIKNAIRAGIRSIEHGIYLDDEAIDMMLDAGTFLVPTLSAPQAVIDAAAAGAALPDVVVAKAHEVVTVHRESFAKAVAAGVRIAMGTDSGVGRHGDNLTELALMTGAGMKPDEVLVAATRTAAELLGVDRELGTIEPGKRADLVLVDGDPFDVAALKSNISAVYKDGRRVR
ncbi:metal-dependent hydrolase family protein [Phytoactinopolyspora halotolerans]|uniref:Amidohydrolase family protein n=1 Tax=Phytoactinopolyspora halotolerans TaxID=1981512 RepID=A0A6L9SDR4_9ACTN|nr:amidohydrolase family protein [Phytoactinopolyspora halotolerans]NEE02754.1 amidohydrolase family protein [Phytoactinopolyspora halotolerans]